MAKEKKSDMKLKYIFIAIMTCIISFAVPFAVKIIQNINASNSFESEENNDDKDEDKEQIIPVLNVPESVEIDKFETDVDFEYSVKYLGNYSISIEVQDRAIATISDEKITPLQVGETNIITTINCNPKIEKYTSLTVLDAVTNIEYKIKNAENKIPEILFVNTTYFLEIEENAINKNTPNINYQNENILQFNFIEKQNNISRFSFEIAKFGEFNFQYINKYCNKNINLFAYNFPQEINVNFSENIYKNGKYYLYLFNEKYLSDANLDNIFNKISYEILVDNSTYDDIYYEISGDAISIENNQIFAEKIGTSSITFTSKISNISQTFTFIVQKIIPDYLTINSQKYCINSNNNLQLKINEEYDFDMQISPKYFYGELSLEHTKNIQYLDKKILLLDNNPGTITIKINDEIFCTIAISYLPEYTFQITLEQSTGTATITENQIDISLSTSNFLVLKCLIIDTTTSKNISIPISITIADQTIITSTNGILELKNNYLTLKAQAKGTTKILFSNPDYDIFYELIVNVS